MSLETHPRSHIPNWKWKGTLAVLVLTTLINGRLSPKYHSTACIPNHRSDEVIVLGYDVSNVANIQPALYKAFGNITLLPWISLSFSLAVFAVLSFSRKILYCVDMKWIYIASLVIFMAGAAVAGAAPNLPTVIVGRVIMGVGGAVVYQRYVPVYL